AQQHAPLPSLAGPVRFPTSQHPQVHIDEERPTPPPPPVAAPSPVFTSAPAVIVEKRGRGTMVAAVAAALVAVVAAGVVVFLLIGRGQTPGGPSGTGQQQGQQQPAGKHGPATGLQLSDRGDAITLRWQDPADGVAGFAVKMGPSREDLKLVTGNLGNKPTFTITGLNAKFTYCFSVVTIYSGTEVLDSDPICTTRSSSKAS
ncbi:MAG: fibronectin type III domain-containing protein, partial [Hamadaea sp.]|nr:fibronectin type III domain-containing protein [Hamadaea sp.]